VQKIAELIEMSFRLWTLVAEGSMCYMGAHWRNLANTTEPFVCGADVDLCQIILTSCYHCAKSKWWSKHCSI